MTLTYGEFCAGYGGLGLAVEEVFGAELAWYSEFEAAPSKIMAHHWPDAPNHGDMTAIDFTAVQQVDILSGGTPCQDLSHAGRRAGMRTGTRSGLWESMREAIATIRPKYVVWENVRGAYSAGASSEADSEVEPFTGRVGAGDGQSSLRALGRVLGDLADLGFDAEWRGLRAADVGAPHGRFRVFVLATRRDATNANNERGDRSGQWTQQDRWREPANGRQPTADAPCLGSGEHVEPRLAGLPATTRTSSAGSRTTTPDAGGSGWDGREGVGGNGGNEGIGSQAIHHVGDGDLSRTDVDWGPYAPAIARWEAVRGTAPAPTELTAKGKHRLSAKFAEWMMGIPADWVTDPAIGISRNEQLKAIGNGVVPQQAAEALRHMLNYERRTS